LRAAHVQLKTTKVKKSMGITPPIRSQDVAENRQSAARSSPLSQRSN